MPVPRCCRRRRRPAAVVRFLTPAPATTPQDGAYSGGALQLLPEAHSTRKEELKRNWCGPRLHPAGWALRCGRRRVAAAARPPARRLCWLKLGGPVGLRWVPDAAPPSPPQR